MKRWRFHINHTGPHTPYTLYRYIILKWRYSNIPTVKKRFQSPSISGRKEKVIIHRVWWETQAGSRLDDPESQNIFEFYYSWWEGRTGWAGWETWLAGCVDCCPPLPSPLLPVVKPVLTFKLSLDWNSGELNAGWLTGEWLGIRVPDDWQLFYRILTEIITALRLHVNMRKNRKLFVQFIF